MIGIGEWYRPILHLVIVISISPKNPDHSTLIYGVGLSVTNLSSQVSDIELSSNVCFI